MIEKNMAKLRRLTVAKAQEFGADLAGIVSVEDLKRSPSHVISERMPEFTGVGTKEASARQRGIVTWPKDARSAIVIAIEHPPEKPELDWWITRASGGNTAGNRVLMDIVAKLSAWLEAEHNMRCMTLPYHIEYGAVYMKDAAVLAGLGCIGNNNLLLTPQYGPRQRLRVMLTEAELPSTGTTDFDPCTDCPKPCVDACPQHAFAEGIYSEADYGLAELPGRTGVFSRLRCNRQMDMDNANFETIEIDGQDTPGKRVKYCRECELACPVGR